MTNTTAKAAATAAAATPASCNEEEEFWPTPSLLTGHKIHTIRFGRNVGNNEPTVLRYKSMPIEELTPLDMIYGGSNRNSNENDSIDPHRDEFYDGTGNLMWMAAVCFGHLVAQQVEPLRSYLWHGPPTTSLEAERNIPATTRRRFCELGCGTGGAGISLLLHHHKNGRGNGKHELSGSYHHVVFTDNDAQSLELCASNCELNNLDPETYSQQLLGWGLEHLERAQQQCLKKGSRLEQPHSFDVVLATDVVYDLKMIAPLFETVDYLLKEKIKTSTSTALHAGENGNEGGGHLVLSHVPRFCIPKEEETETCEDQKDNASRQADDDDDDFPGEAFLELERFICSEANKVGLVLADTIRPHQVLSEEGLGNNENGDDNDNDEGFDDDSMRQLTLETMKDAHAVVFVFGRA
jgi:hypothetical protein